MSVPSSIVKTFHSADWMSSRPVIIASTIVFCIWAIAFNDVSLSILSRCERAEVMYSLAYVGTPLDMRLLTSAKMGFNPLWIVISNGAIISKAPSFMLLFFCSGIVSA